jgi:large repetitive protein
MFRVLSAPLACALLLLAACTTHHSVPGATMTIGGTVSGLTGSGLTLEDNGGDALTITADGAFTFATALPTGSPYAVTVSAQPNAPRQVCTLLQSTGTVALADVTNVLLQCVNNSYPVGGTVSGLQGHGLILQDNGGSDLAVNANGAFTFAQPVLGGSTYAVTVKTQPSTPAQVCTVATGTGTVANAAASTAVVTCITQSFAVGGTVIGLVGTGLALQNSGGTSIAISRNGAFSFPISVLSGQAYAVTLKTQPVSPTQTCTVSGGTGTVGNGDVTTVTINCSNNLYTIGGTVSGLMGIGATLQYNGANDLALTGNGTFAFVTPLASGAAFAVTVKAQATGPSQTCQVSQGIGSVGASNVTSVVVACTTNTYAIGGTISGLAGAGLLLQDNLGDTLAVPTGATSFVFATPVSSGTTFAVTIVGQPVSLSQTCTVTTGTDTGSVTNAAITSVAVACVTNLYAVSATVTGLSGTGLVLQDNGGDSLTIRGNGTIPFVTPVASGSAFNVTVQTQPSAPAQTCTVAGGSGTVVSADVTSVTVNCSSNQFTVSGSVTGLGGAGLTLTLNGGAGLAISGNGSFAFPVTLVDQSMYTVVVTAQPASPSQTCLLSGDMGTVAGASVTSVQVTCTTNLYTVGGTVTGLQGTGLILQDNGGDDFPVAGNGSFTFATSVLSGHTYTVTASGQPTSNSQTCTVTNGIGTVGSGNVTNVTVACSTTTFAVGGSISGLSGSVVLKNNAGDTLLLTANGPFGFAVPVASGSPYAVTVSLQPSSPSQTCTVTNDASGTVTDAPISDITVACVTNSFTIGGTVVGLSGMGLVLHDSLGESLPVSANGAFVFLGSQVSGGGYAVTITSQPTSPTQLCAIFGGTGTIGSSNVTSITVNCTLSYTVGGGVTGLSGSGLVLENNSADDLLISGNGGFAFATPLPSGANYAVTVSAQPTTPWQTCLVSAGAGPISNADITNVALACTTNSYNISVSVTGLTGGGAVVLTNASDTLTFSADGTATFATMVASGGTYAVSVQTQPASPPQLCTVTAGSDAVTGSDVTVNVACVSNGGTVGGTVSGLTGSGLILRDNGGDDLPISANGAFVFATALTSGTSYFVTVLTHPGSPSQVCFVSGGVGTMGSTSLTGVNVNCYSSQDGEILFSACDGSGAGGPSQDYCSAAYGETQMNGQITLTGGIQTWTVPQSGDYVLTASGAQGGTSQFPGGLGAAESGIFTLAAGDSIQVIVGQMGTGSASANQCGGGGGGSYIVQNGTPVLIAAGGGGGDGYAGLYQRGLAASAVCTTTGAGGVLRSGSWGAAGGGFSDNGGDDGQFAKGGSSFTNGGVGGTGGTMPQGGSCEGGFGGGGAGGYFTAGGSAGGGGGYVGGDGALGGNAASGGVSCNSTSSPTHSTGGAAAGDGLVTITFLPD